MDPKLLSQLREVIVQGSLSRAALSLNVTQPTLTRNMKAIEEAVGAPVLRRGRYGVTPTKIGERLSEQGRIISSAMTMADETVQHWRTGLTSEVRLGVDSMTSASLMPGFFATNPLKDEKFSVRVVAAEPTDLKQKLRSREIDMAILPSCSESVMDKLTQVELGSDEFCVMAGSRSPLVNLSDKIKTRLLLTQTWMSINNTAQIKHCHDQVVKLLGIDSIVPKFRFDGDVSAPITLLRNSDMLSLAPRQFAEKYVAKGGIHILDIDVELPKCEIFLATRKENENDSSAMKLSEMIKNYFCDFAFLTETESLETTELPT